MISVDFVFDFGSPNAYLAHQLLPQIEERTGATFNYVPCLLGGIFKASGNQSPFFAFAGIQGKLAYEELEIRRFIKKHGLTKFVMNPHFPINTLLLMRGAIVAHEEERLRDYVEAGFRHMWEEPKKMDAPEVFVSAMSEAGFDGNALLERTKDPAVKAKLIENTTHAVERGAFGVPTFYVGEEMFFGKDRLGQVEEAILDAG